MPAYSGKAQPYLDAIAASFFSSQAVRDWIVFGTSAASTYTGAKPLGDEQRDKRWIKGRTKQPFWANYWCGLDRRCICRIPGSKGLESDAIFFMRNQERRVLALHVEFKHPREPFQFGQPESYPRRAACFVKTWKNRSSINEHHDWATVIFCGSDALSDSRMVHFQRIITHEEARKVIAAYPSS
jgi:hypothetical protein